LYTSYVIGLHPSALFNGIILLIKKKSFHISVLKFPKYKVSQLIFQVKEDLLDIKLIISWTNS
jgi:hypothetical protein